MRRCTKSTGTCSSETQLLDAYRKGTLSTNSESLPLLFNSLSPNIKPMVDFNKLTTELFPYAYNILGSVADSEDVVQDVLIKFNSQNDAEIASPKAYLIKAVIHRAINLRKKNERVRSQHIQLPEP